jgi:hypothetical protein
MFPFYDWLFGTYYEAGLCTARMGALDTGVPDKNPIAIYIHPFIAWNDMIVRRLRKRKQKVSKTMITPAE